MSKTFRRWKIDEPLLLPPVVQEFVAKDHLARFVLSLVRDEIDLAAITASYDSDRGQPPFDPVMMTALLLYSYCCGIYASRRIAKACRERVDFMSIVGFDAPDFRTVSEFRRRHLKALGALFRQILRLCETAGLVKLGHVALDGTKIKANASKHKAMSYERMEKWGNRFLSPCDFKELRVIKRARFTTSTLAASQRSLNSIARTDRGESRKNSTHAN